MSDPRSTLRIGQILIERGVLCEQQVFEVLQRQRRSHIPFGVLAEQMFDVTIESIEQAWIEQFCRRGGVMDLSHQRIEPRALGLLSRRQAWQFEMLPLRYEGGGELLVAASARRLARAVAFAARQLRPVTVFRVAPLDQLRLRLRKHYPMSEVTDEMLDLARRLRPA